MWKWNKHRFWFWASKELSSIMPTVCRSKDFFLLKVIVLIIETRFGTHFVILTNSIPSPFWSKSVSQPVHFTTPKIGSPLTRSSTRVPISKSWSSLARFGGSKRSKLGHFGSLLGGVGGGGEMLGLRTRFWWEFATTPEKFWQRNLATKSFPRTHSKLTSF